MLDMLRRAALTVIAATRHCTLSTMGPTGLQASVVDCIVCDGCVYLLIPATSEHCFNLEHTLEVLLTTSHWQVRGAGLALVDEDGRYGTAPQVLRNRAGEAGQTVVEVFPLRMHIAAGHHRRYCETIDFDICAP